jgi:hypothetical protein
MGFVAFPGLKIQTWHPPQIPSPNKRPGMTPGLFLRNSVPLREF